MIAEIHCSICFSQHLKPESSLQLIGTMLTSDFTRLIFGPPCSTISLHFGWKRGGLLAGQHFSVGKFIKDFESPGSRC